MRQSSLIQVKLMKNHIELRDKLKGMSMHPISLEKKYLQIF